MVDRLNRENGSVKDHDISRWEEVVYNVMSTRSNFFQQLMDPRRDIDAECGYPPIGQSVDVGIYQQLYDRNAIAARVVEVMSKESWQVTPTVYETEDPEPTPFEEAWDALGKSLRGEQSWYKEELGSPIWSYLLRADILAGIGHFGIILLGFDDDQPLWAPVAGVSTVPRKEVVANVKNKDGVDLFSIGGTEKQYYDFIQGTPEKFAKKREGTKLKYIRVYPESLVQIVQYEADQRSPRFGQPVRYSITLNDPRDQHSGVGLNLSTVYVHWSRVIHVVDHQHQTGAKIRLTHK